MDRKLKKVKKLAWYTHKTVEEILPKKRARGAGNKRGDPSEEELKERAVKKQRLQRKDEEKAQKRVEDLKEKVRQKRIQRLEAENEAETRLIKKLEKQLHLNKRKNKSVAPVSFANDGLDYLLDVLENPGMEMEGKGVLDDDENTDSENEEEVTNVDDFDGSADDGVDSFDEDFSDTLDEEDPMEDDEPDDSEQVEEEEIESASFREDIYGRIRDGEGNLVKPETAGRYVPPARKEAAAGGSEAQIQLARQLKRLLNKLTEANMAGFVSQVEELYATNSRHDMNETLTNLVFASCVSPSLMPKRFALEHGMFMGLLYQNIGAETGAFYMQRLLKQYDDLVSSDATTPEEDKRLDNVLLLWCHAYNFKILHASMIFDLLGELSARFNEKDIDMILLILRDVGFSLRKDDPAALKTLIEQIQAKVTDKRITDPQMGARIGFMMDTVTGIKNNNMKKIPNYDPSEFEHLIKVFRSLIHKGHVMETPLKISLTDLRMASERGKWWVVGAAWNKPDLPVEEDADKQPKMALVASSFKQNLLDLAVKQRMNTDVRKAIFCTIMNAEDYNDAFQSVMKLHLKNAQEAEIVHVLVHCGLNESPFNPFYSFVLEKFCLLHRRYQKMVLFTLWDKIRCLWDEERQAATLTPVQQKNLASMVAHGLTHNHALPITVLKKINLAQMKLPKLRFLRTVLAHVLLTPTDGQVNDIFAPLLEKKFKAFREMLRLVLVQFIRRNAKKVLKGKFATFSVEFLEGRIAIAEQAILGSNRL
ncbi:Nucleolar MIF4G domain-containing protein 1 [Hypsibius exemplaris]|uniref:Nucleolar MIF4G domain-containing protein 1 n=1 Tax=Hypsibius exemplaris TaxID=2072580 RepID=A0A1W0WYQ8_HYPEX|nr:Nucleolar MIF4G domain-containing protein 1 [Hypsibius exemplaris]